MGHYYGLMLKIYNNKEDDQQQMGGDFVVNSTGRFLLAHCSTNPTDRPSVQSLLQACKN